MITPLSTSRSSSTLRALRNTSLMSSSPSIDAWTRTREPSSSRTCTSPGNVTFSALPSSDGVISDSPIRSADEIVGFTTGLGASGTSTFSGSTVGACASLFTRALPAITAPFQFLSKGIPLSALYAIFFDNSSPIRLSRRL